MLANISNAIREVVLASGWNQGKALDVIVKDDHIIICIAGKPRYSLEELIHNAKSPLQLELT